jgi:lipoprotein-anchoring transpeptidase ErfK/SrfK
MKSSLVRSRIAIVLVLCAAFALVATPASAVGRGPVPDKTVIATTVLSGMTEADARAAITSAVTVPPLAPVIATANGRAFSFDPTPVVKVDVEAILNDAYAASGTDTTTLSAKYAIDSAGIGAWVASVAAQTDKAAINARYAPGAKRLYLSGAASGLKTDVTAGTAVVQAVITVEVAAGGAAQPTVVIPVNVVYPVITGDTHGRVIMVILRERRLLLYNKGKVERTFRTAVGMRRYPTPTGTFKIIRKVKMPSWNNPGSAWAKSMPRYIKPGPGNPLGTRALYLNSSGIRIHGTNKLSSIGTAASHGCVRLARKDIELLYTLVPVGTQVFIVK